MYRDGAHGGQQTTCSHLWRAQDRQADNTKAMGGGVSLLRLHYDLRFDEPPVELAALAGHLSDEHWAVMDII